MQLCRTGRGGICVTHGQQISECEERVAAAKATPVLAGGKQWTLDIRANMVRCGDINMSLTDLLVLHDALVTASDVRCVSCGALDLVRGNRCISCGTN